MPDRPVRALSFQGPLGLWPWPVVNVLMRFLGSSPAAARSLTPTMANEERWSWIDYKGKKRELLIERQVKEL